jgi:hypothetical protein
VGWTITIEPISIAKRYFQTLSTGLTVARFLDKDDNQIASITLMPLSQNKNLAKT